MDSELVSDSLPVGENGGAKKSFAPVKTYTEQFYEVFPYYLSIGMTADEFWNQDCTLTKYYRKAHAMQLDRKNEELWLQGMYIYEALCDASPLLHAFAKQGTKPLPYPNEPFPRTEKEAELREIKAREARFEMARARMASRANKNKE